MAISHRYHTDRTRLALELTMRDVLEGLEELANLDVYWFDTACLEILSIEPPRQESVSIATPPQPAVSARVLSFPGKRTLAG